METLKHYDRTDPWKFISSLNDKQKAALLEYLLVNLHIENSKLLVNERTDTSPPPFVRSESRLILSDLSYNKLCELEKKYLIERIDVTENRRLKKVEFKVISLEKDPPIWDIQSYLGWASQLYYEMDKLMVYQDVTGRHVYYWSCVEYAD